ncbi:MAG: O-antigen ligase family protein [Patescibacteria group bacterium]|jgi:O-antigen ligase/tetratricopeptide (TPR) repeat protein
MSQKFYLYVLKIGSIFSFLCVLFVFKGLLFPFITSKQLPFNILIEVLFVFWLTLIIKFPQWNPFKKNAEGKRRQAITWGIFAFAIGMLASLFVTVDFNLSFWGDVERMLGIFHILHFFVLYLIIITVFRDWRDWKALFIALLSSTVLVALNGINDTKSTIGNNAYVSVYMMIGAWIACWLFYKDTFGPTRARFQIVKWLYLLPLPLFFWIMSRVDISGVFVGTAAGLVSGAFLYGIANTNKKARRSAWIVLAVLIGILALLIINREKIPQVNAINFQKNTFQTRLISWKAAWNEFHNHPAFGVGWGNFSIIFDKDFKASFYDYSRGETYFDRAHNNVVDISATTGLFGILCYLSIFIVLAFYLIRLRRSGRISAGEFAIWSSLFIAYFVQNLAIFDSFVTYLCFMTFLGYVHWLANTREDSGNESALLSIGGPKELINKEIFSLALSGLVMIIIIYQATILPWKMLTGVIDGQIAFGKGDIKGAFEVSKQAFSYNTPLDRDGRSIFIRSITSKMDSISSLDSALADSIISYAIKQSEKNVALNPKDSMMLMEQARLYDAAFRVTRDKVMSAEYSQKAIENIDASLASSPERIPIYFLKSQFLVGQGKIDEAISILEYSRHFNENFFESDCQLGQMYLLRAGARASTSPESLSDTEKGYANLDVCLANGGADMLVVERIIGQAINYYLGKGDLSKAISLYEQLVRYQGKNSKIWISMAQLYVKVGENDKAEYCANKAAELDPSIKSDVEEFIRQLKQQ